MNYDSRFIRFDYNYFRYYDPSTGRYITSDPIGLGGGLNTYGYVGGNPLTNIDRFGLSYWGLPDDKMPNMPGHPYTGTDLTAVQGLLWNWLTGTGPDTQVFGPGSSMAEQMRNAPKVLEALKAYDTKNKNHNDCGCKGAQALTNYKGNFGLPGLWNAGLNPAQQYIGSYRIDIFPLPECKKLIVLNNTTSFKSFAYGIAVLS